MSKFNHTTKIYLFKPKAEKPTPLVLSLSYANRRLRYFVGYSIHPKQWNSKTNRVRSTAGSAEMNGLLDRITSEAEAILLRLSGKGFIPSPEQIREELEKFVKGDTQNELAGKSFFFVM